MKRSEPVFLHDLSHLDKTLPPHAAQSDGSCNIPSILLPATLLQM